MHLAWVQAKGKLTACPLCIDEQQEQHIPLDQRKEQPLPCPKHGDPAYCLPGNREIIQIYGHMQPGSHIFLEQSSGEKTIRKAYLNLPVCKTLCDAYGLDFIDALEKLEIIHKELWRD